MTKIKKITCRTCRGSGKVDGNCLSCGAHGDCVCIHWRGNSDVGRREQIECHHCLGTGICPGSRDSNGKIDQYCCTYETF